MSSGAIGYDIVLVAHVTAGLVGFGSVAVTGAQAAEARRLSAGGSDVLAGGGGRATRLRRYFAPGPNLPSRLVYLVPLLGLLLVTLSGDPERLYQLWLDAATALWVLAAGLAQLVVWPGEARLQRELATEAPSRATVEQAARRVEVAVGLIALAYVAAFVLMVGQPGG